MDLISKEITTLDRYQSFIVFDPASIRISDSDIFLIGKDVRDLFDEVHDKVLSCDSDIKMRIMANQLGKLANMLDLLGNYDNVIITKFFDRIWRRYSYVSHLGESFLKMSVFLDFFPEYDNQFDKVVATRIDENVAEFEEGIEDTKDDDHDEDEDENLEKEKDI